MSENTSLMDHVENSDNGDQAMFGFHLICTLNFVVQNSVIEEKLNLQ